MKTLKDLFDELRELMKKDLVVLSLLDIIEKKIKAEAIKWVKAIKKENEEAEGYTLSYADILDRFERFHNITEADLQ